MTIKARNGTIFSFGGSVWLTWNINCAYIFSKIYFWFNYIVLSEYKWLMSKWTFTTLLVFGTFLFTFHCSFLKKLRFFCSLSLSFSFILSFSLSFSLVLYLSPPFSLFLFSLTLSHSNSSHISFLIVRWIPLPCACKNHILFQFRQSSLTPKRCIRSCSSLPCFLFFIWELHWHFQKKKNYPRHLQEKDTEHTANNEKKIWWK